ncbi:MAG: MMPL family transporter [Deltaproteobacteria bacterium]|nr:MMPL family transporter [Deltaproteobacteria bacterium]
MGGRHGSSSAVHPLTLSLSREGRGDAYPKGWINALGWDWWTSCAPAGHPFEWVLERLVSGCLRAAAWLTAGKRPWGVIGGVCGLFAIVALLFVRGHIVSGTHALEFIHGTLVEKEARLLNRPGNVGFEFLDLLVEPVRGETLTDPHFLARAWELQTALKGVSGSRETTSILSTVHQIAYESFKKSLPETPEEVAAAFFLIESRLALAVQRQLYFPGGVRISVSYGTDDSVELGRFCEVVLALARWDFPDLKVSAFNKVPLYPQVDKYVREGKVSNVFVSQFGIACICALLLWWRNRQFTQVRLSPLWGGVVMSLPLFFATAVMGLVMWGLRIPLDMSTASIGALAINAATDFSLYLAMTYQETLRTFSPRDALREAVGREGRVILADCLLNTCCFLPLITSHFLPVRQLGWMMGVMLVACAAGTLTLMAALLPLCATRKEHSYASRPVFSYPGFGDDRLPDRGECGADRPGDYLPGAAAAHCSLGVCLGGDDGVPRGAGKPLLLFCDGKAVGGSDPDRVGAS